MSVWVNDITAALRATNFNSSYHTDSIINNELYCKNILFVTGPGIVEEKTLEYDIKYFEEMPNDKKDNYIKDGDDAATSVSKAGEYYVTIEFIGQDTTNYEILPAIVTKFIATTSTESV